MFDNFLQPFAALGNALPQPQPEDELTKWFNPPAAQPPGQVPGTLPLSPPAPAPAPLGPVAAGAGLLPPTRPFAAPAEPFKERFVPIGPNGGGRFVGNRDDEIQAMADAVASRTTGNIGGTGFGASGNYYEPNGAAYQLHAAQMGQQAGNDFLKLASGTDLQNFQAQQGEANRQAEVEKARLQANAHLLGAQAAHSPDAIRGALAGKVGEGLLGGTINPENVRAMNAFLGSLHGGQTAAPVQPAAGVAAGAGLAVPPNVMADVQAIKAGKEGALAASGAFGQPDPATGLFKQTPGLGATNAEQFADEMSRMPPDQRASVMRAVMEGKYGPRDPVIQAIAQAAAKNQYLSLGMPTDLRNTPTRGIPGQVTFADDTGPLMHLGVKQAGPLSLGNIRSSAFNAGIPYNQLTLANGQVIPFDPSLLGTTGKAMGFGSPVNKEQATTRAGILAEALGLTMPDRKKR